MQKARKTLDEDAECKEVLKLLEILTVVASVFIQKIKANNRLHYDGSREDQSTGR